MASCLGKRYHIKFQRCFTSIRSIQGIRHLFESVASVRTTAKFPGLDGKAPSNAADEEMMSTTAVEVEIPLDEEITSSPALAENFIISSLTMIQSFMHNILISIE